MGIAVSVVPMAELTAVGVLLVGVPVTTIFSAVMSAEFAAGELDLFGFHIFFHGNVLPVFD